MDISPRARERAVHRPLDRNLVVFITERETTLRMRISSQNELLLEFEMTAHVFDNVSYIGIDRVILRRFILRTAEF